MRSNKTNTEQKSLQQNTTAVGVVRSDIRTIHNVFVTCSTLHSPYCAFLSPAQRRTIRANITSSVSCMVELVLLLKRYSFFTPPATVFCLLVRTLTRRTISCRSGRTSSMTRLGYKLHYAILSTGNARLPTQRLRCAVSHFCLCCNK